MGSLLAYELRSRWGVILGWGIGLILFGAMYITIYPQAAEQMAGLADLPIYQAMGVRLGSFEDFIASTVILFVPIFLGIYALLAGTATLAGEEERGTLELLVTARLPRWQVVTAKALALSLTLLLIIVVAGAGNALTLAAIADQVETGVTGADLFLAVLGSWPLVVAILMVALFLGALLPSRRVALMVGTALFIASYFGKNIAVMVESLEWLQPLSIFSYFNATASALHEGTPPRDLAVLVAVALVFFALALASFERRDLTVGTWPWQWARPPRPTL